MLKCRSMCKGTIMRAFVASRHATVLVGTACLMGVACGSTAPREKPAPGTYFFPVEQQYECYLPDEASPRLNSLKAGPFNDEEVDVLVGLWEQIVAPHHLWETPGRVRPIDAVVVTLATQSEDAIHPGEEFLTRIASDTLRVRAPLPNETQFPRVELRLWGWTSADTANVESMVHWREASTSRSSLAIRETSGWKLCTYRGIGQLNIIWPAPR